MASYGVCERSPNRHVWTRSHLTGRSTSCLEHDRPSGPVRRPFFMSRGTSKVSLRRFAVSVASAAVAVALSSTGQAAEPASAKNDPAGPTTAGERASAEKRPREEAEHLRIGPMVGVGFPRPFAIEGFAKIEKLVGVGLEYSFLPRMNFANVDASFEALAADLRVFPFKGAFFVGARVGRQWLDAKARLQAGQLGAFNESMAASTWFVNPRAGFLFTFRSGITIGIDAGVQVPVNPSYERAGRATETGIAAQTGIDGTLVAVANGLGNKTTPTVDLLRLGFLF